jgi:para-nitrobenzyl esterase
MTLVFRSILMLLALIYPAAATEQEVATKAGPLRGEQRADGMVFRSIPYAVPPVGERRWRPPLPAPRRQAVRDVRAEAPVCPQQAEGSTRVLAEDCLYLAVATPSLKPARPLPVLVWIHGGNNVMGRGGWGVDGRFQQHGLVVVSLQFRLGALGYLSHPALSAEDGASGNYGLMDQQLALRWVRDNIAAFGGDPRQVTLMGQSTGGQQVMLHMQAKGSRGLFHRAIVLSANTNFETKTRSLAEAEAQGLAVMRTAGLGDGASAAEMRAVPAAKLVEAAAKAPVVGYDNPWLAFLPPVVDGRVIARDPLAALRERRGVRVPLLIGANMREEELWGGTTGAMWMLREGYGARADAALKPYGGLSDDAMWAIAADLVYRCRAVDIAKSARGPVWLYHYGLPGRDGKPVSHGSEIAPLFGFDGQDSPMRAYLAAFAKAGDPNAAGLVRWPRYSAKAREHLEFLPEGVRVGARLREPFCDWAWN